MKFEVTDSFRADRKRLSKKERDLVTEVLPTFVEACDRYAANPAAGWPASLRVKGVAGAPGVCEVTFNFSGPDLRATFEWVQIDGGLAVRWRRIGGHGDYLPNVRPPIRPGRRGLAPTLTRMPPR